MDRLIRLFLAATWLALVPASAQTSCGTLSGCPSASLPLNGLEWMYVLQGGISKKVTSGDAVSGVTILPIAQFTNKAAFLAGFVTPATQLVRIDTVATPVSGAPAGYSTFCPLWYRKSGSQTGLYGEVFLGNAYWEPLYSIAPVQACEFGAIGDATVPTPSGAAFTATANGTATVTLTSGSTPTTGMAVTVINPKTNTGIAPVSGTTIQNVAGTTITLTHVVPTTGSVNFVAWTPLNNSTVTGTDNTAPIQAAINYALQYHYHDVVLQTGAHKITDTLHLGWGDSFYGVTLSGAKRAPLTVSQAGTSIASTMADRMAVSVQGIYNGGVYGLTIFGPITNYVYYGQKTNNVLSSNVNDWLPPEYTVPIYPGSASSGGFQTNSPLAGITVDAYSGAAPGDPYPNVTFPSFTGLNAGNTYNRNLSSDLTFEEDQIQGFAVGLVSGLNTDSQGDFIRIRGGSFTTVPYGVSINNNQSRNVEVQNISGNTVYTFLGDSQFGKKDGMWDGTLANVSLGGVYQLADFGNLGLAGTLVFKNTYCENCVRVGNFNGGTAFNNSVIFQGGHFDLQDYLHGQIPASYITATSGQIVLQGTKINTNSRLNTLIAGGQPSFKCDGCEIVAGTNLAPNQTPWNAYGSGAAAMQSAINYFGGLNIGQPLLNTLYLNEATVSQGLGTYFASSSATSANLGVEPLDDTIQASSTSTQLPMTQAGKFFIDRSGRRWRMSPPYAGLFQMTVTIYVPAYGVPAWTNDVMTFTLTSAYFNTAANHIQPGWVIYHVNTGTMFLVVSVGAADGNGNYPITTIQQNNLLVNPSTSAFVANTLSDTTLSGYCFAVNATVTLPANVEFGTFTAVSNGITGITGYQDAGTSIGTYLANGMSLFGPGYFETTGNAAWWPVPPYGVVTLSGVTPGAPGSATMSGGVATTSGRFPIFPFPLN